MVIWCFIELILINIFVNVVFLFMIFVEYGVFLNMFGMGKIILFFMIQKIFIDFNFFVLFEFVVFDDFIYL